MNPVNVASEDVDQCRAHRHRFQVVGSDKTPMKRSLACLTCSEKTGKNVYVAFGIDTLSWGGLEDTYAQ